MAATRLSDAIGWLGSQRAAMEALVERLVVQNSFTQNRRGVEAVANLAAGLTTAERLWLGTKQNGLRSLLELRALGLKDVGFGITASDLNAMDMIELYRLADAMGLEFATASTHNSYYFHKHDNAFKDPEKVAREFEKISFELLKSRRVKNWFRAYFIYGMANYVRGGKRLLPCEVGTDMLFLDPYGKIMPCNGMDAELPMGDLTQQSFDEIWSSPQAAEVRAAVKKCDKNCWMIGSVAPAMKKDMLTPLRWIIKQKLSGDKGRHCE